MDILILPQKTGANFKGSSRNRCEKSTDVQFDSLQLKTLERDYRYAVVVL